MSIEIQLSEQIDAELAANIEKQSVYVSPHIRKLRVSGTRQTVALELEDGAATDEIREKVGRFLYSMITGYRDLGSRVLHKNERKDKGALAVGVYDELKRRGWCLELGHGQIGLAGPALALARAFDRSATSLGLQRFAGVEHDYPALIPTSVLARCGYFASFPQSVSLVCRLVEDFDLIEDFRKANTGASELVVPRPERLLVPSACLTPAVCYHCYQSLEGQTLEDPGRVVTTVGRVFRYESKNITGLDRLWDFHQRDVIFLGTEPFVLKKRQAAIEYVKEQVAEWDIESSIETASDPFFPTVSASKTFWQMSQDLKYEVKVAVEPAGGKARAIAASSFNLHGNFFGSTFNFKAADGQPAWTSCVGWGLERWVLAGFTQHGFEKSRWPDSLRADVFG